MYYLIVNEFCTKVARPEMKNKIGRKSRLDMSAYMMNVVYTSSIYVHKSLILCTYFMCYIH
uniref:Uncharacterized protein n=2 Tax=unclassified bacterial viruses TaxID=12333 RepID=A0A8S5R7L3_9VIRU|nr:MAG TPA: hypothetical protein [virus sp. cthq354]DAE27624.1 MAG TPA: hypothetical protein [virus sp. ctf7E27]